MADRTPLAQAIYDEAMARPLRAGRRQDWHRDDPGHTVDDEARWTWEEACADAMADDRDGLYDGYDPDDDRPHAGGARWDALLSGETWT